MKLFFSKVVIFIIIFILAISFVSCSNKKNDDKQNAETQIEAEYGEEINDVGDSEIENEHTDEATNAVNDDVIYVEMEIIHSQTDENNEENTIEENTTENEELVSLGQFTLTAYCSCVKCCGKYAYGRPVDENGNEIVHGAIGETLISGVSIAVDPYVIPFYTEVVINGQTYIAHDTGGLIRGNRIDVYFDNHEAACAFGLQYSEVFIKR